MTYRRQRRQGCFNTQPPEGGWNPATPVQGSYTSFNTQPPEGGWNPATPVQGSYTSFNTQPPEGGWLPRWKTTSNISSCFNTQPPEGGWACLLMGTVSKRCFNTQPPEGGWLATTLRVLFVLLFQHTAARRRLELQFIPYMCFTKVSTHSRPKAAGSSPSFAKRRTIRFNTQPPEGGWADTLPVVALDCQFQHTAARRRLVPAKGRNVTVDAVSTHSRPKAAGRSVSS